MKYNAFLDIVTERPDWTIKEEIGAVVINKYAVSQVEAAMDKEKE